MNGFEKRSNLKKLAIVESAHALFLKHGWRHATIQMIAKAASVSQVTIYNHFGSKENVLHAVLKRIFETHARSFESIVYNASKGYKEKMDELYALEMNHAKALGKDLLSDIYKTKNTRIKNLLKWYEDNRYSIALDYLVREGKNEAVINQSVSNAAYKHYFYLLRHLGEVVDFKTMPTYEGLLNLFFYGLGGKT